MSLPSAILIAGPTSSGKSGLALAAAKEFGGTVINADSMQVYSAMRVLTARPSPEDEAAAPHRLYGILPPSDICSAARWRDMAAAAMEESWQAGRVPIVVGGTGLYLRALAEGLSPVPDIPAGVRDRARALLSEMGNRDFHALLARRDPVMAARLDPGNSQRLARAWEVIEATGRSLADWQALPPQGAVAARWLAFTLLPPRDALYAVCDGRFRRMVETGALEEVRAMMALDLESDRPAMKALGLAELTAHLRGELPLAEAMDRAAQATRNYAKRQMTWFRHQMRDAHAVSEHAPDRLPAHTFPPIERFLSHNR